MPECIGTMPSPTAQLTILAFDFGLQRIGVGVGNTVSRTSQALEVIHAPDNPTRFSRIEQLIAQWQSHALVVGLPFHPDGTEHDMTRRARKFANQLHGRFGLPVALVDERYSSVAAQSRQAPVTSHQQRLALQNSVQGLDAQAAQILLQQYLDSLPL